MKRFAVLLLLMGPAFAAGHPAVEEARGPYEAAVAAADARYRGAAADALRVYEALLREAVKCALRQEGLDPANRLDRYRQEVAWQRSELLARSYPGGTVRVRDPGGAAQAHAECDAALRPAAKRYRTELAHAAEPFLSTVAHALSAARRAGDLEAANRHHAEIERGKDRARERQRTLSTTAISFSVPGARDLFEIEKPKFWRVEDGELTGMEGKGEGALTAVLKRAYRRMTTVTVRGRIVAHEKNFRMAVGPVNLILNWERSPECHFRYHEQLKVVKRPLLTPGRFHEITVRQATETGIEILVDGVKVCDLEGKLHGTITLYPSNSAIGITDLFVEGDPTNRRAREPSHRIW